MKFYIVLEARDEQIFGPGKVRSLPENFNRPGPMKI